MPKTETTAKLDGVLKSGVKRQVRRSEPLWKGPEVDGITQSLLGRFLVCRERFRLLVVEGLKQADTFNHRLGYGEMWHVCEESHAAQMVGGPAQVKPWDVALQEYCKKQCEKYPLQQEQIQHWYEVCRLQFPIYVEYWRKHRDTVKRIPLAQEEVFDVPYRLPSGRIVRLRGKFDGVDSIKG
jgi:hypothetical protein